MIRKIIVFFYSVIMVGITLFVTPIKVYALNNSSYIHVKIIFRSILLPSWETFTDSKSVLRYDLNFPVLLALWIIITVLATSAFYIFGTKNNPDH